MTRTARPRRPLPRRVYWTRRVLVLGVAPAIVVASVIGLAHLLGGSSAGSPDTAVTVRSTTSTQPTVTLPAVTPSALPSSTAGLGGSRLHTGKHRVLPQPDGACNADDVLITPELPDPHAYGPVKVVLELTTRKSVACTFDVDSQTVFLTISSGDQVLWSSEDCPATIPSRTVVPRRDHAARVRLTWDGKESDRVCSKYGSWVPKGDYVASAVARGSVTPVDVGFSMQPGIAVHPTITVTPTATPTPSGTPTAPKGHGRSRNRGTPTAGPSPTSSASPSSSPSR